MMHTFFIPSAGDSPRVYSGGTDDAPNVRLWTDAAHIEFSVPGMTRADADKIAGILKSAIERSSRRVASYTIAAE